MLHPSSSDPPRMRRTANWARPLVLFLIIALLASSFFPELAYAAADEPRVNPRLVEMASANPDTTYRVIIQRVRGNRSIDNTVVVNRGRKLRDMRIDAFVVEAPGRLIKALARSRNIKYMTFDAPMISTSQGSSISSNNLATAFPRAVMAANRWPSGITGAGVGVAIIDSGIDATLPDWCGPTGASRIVTRQVFAKNISTTVNDAYGHGTHIAGIVAGNSWCTNDSALTGKYMGIAPEANLIDLVVTNANGVSYTSDVVDAIEWAIANRNTYNIRVLNLSLVSSIAESYRFSVLAAAVERAWFNGIFVVVASGNTGPQSIGYPPANDPFVMTVGAADSKNTNSRWDDGIAPWSSYGFTQDGFLKPEIVAPGRLIPGPLASGSAWATAYPDRVVDARGRYIWMSGTSMAAPVVAGVAALMFQQHPEWTNDQVKWLFTETAYWLPNVSWMAQGAGQIDAYASLYNDGTPEFANQGVQISYMLATVDGSVNYASANWSTANWSTANWSTANWSTANWSTANWSTANWSTANAASTSLDGNMTYVAPSDPVSEP